MSKIPRTLNRDEERRLLRVTLEHTRGFRDHVIILLALKTGLREHEILALNIADVFNDVGHVRQAVQLGTYKGDSQAMNAENQLVWLTHPGLREKLATLLKAKGKAKHDVSPSAPLFTRARAGGRKSGRVDRAGRLTDRALRHIFNEWQTRAGFDRHFRFHDLRHTACTNYHELTGKIAAVQKFARHKSITSTSIYTHVSDEYQSTMTGRL